MSKLGFTFYPKDWWTSDTFFELEPVERYIYLECIFLMYQNDGYIKTQKTYFENRNRIKISSKVWDKITSKFIQDEKGYTLLSVNSRLKKAISSRENGRLGGRPRKPKKPKKETYKNPPLERERETKVNDNDSIFTIDECRLKYLNNKKVLEAVSKNKKNRITIDEIPTRLSAFNKKLLENSMQMKPYKDYCSHFLNWHKKTVVNNKPFIKMRYV